jgi:exopolyphosphatase/guanosine-5'-triphosphate,3'-diphosphate pyrophosphatase
MRIATIDIGTNTVLLLIAERTSRGELVAVSEQATITRLGEGVDRTRSLAPAAIARTTACLDAYAEAIRAAGVTRVAVVGTSAMRDAQGGEAIRSHVRSVLGVEARTISGDEEARLTFTGAVSGLGVSPGERVVVFDIGGGSTEVVSGEVADGGSPRLDFAKSFDVGSVRLTERHVRTDPPTLAELAAVAEGTRSAFDELPRLLGQSDRPPVGIAGTMTTLAAVSLEMDPYDGPRVHGHTMPVSELSRVVDRLAAADLATRRTLKGMEPKRADVIVAGGVLARTLLEKLGASAVRISDRGVRWGLAMELANAG